MTDERPRLRQLPCPYCNTVGSIVPDYSSAAFRCQACGTSGFSLAQIEKHVKEHTQKKRQPQSRDEAVHGDLTPLLAMVPDDASPDDILIDYLMVRDETGALNRGPRASAYYLPLTNDGNHEPFDPQTPQAQFAKYRLRKEVQRVRRYARDLRRRARQRQDPGS